MAAEVDLVMSSLSGPESIDRKPFDILPDHGLFSIYDFQRSRLEQQELVAFDAGAPANIRSCYRPIAG